MATTRDGYYDQGRSIVRPPLFKGTNFAYWKNLMQMFIKTEDYELWNIITKGLCVPTTTVDWKVVKKTEEQYTQEDYARLSKNYKAMHILYCGLDANEYNRICACESAKEIWDKLVVMYEGQVKSEKQKSTCSSISTSYSSCSLTRPSRRCSLASPT